MRIAVVGPWSSPCGIAVYSADVARELAARGAEVRAFAYADPLPAETPAPRIPVSRCWQLGQAPGWVFARELAAFAPNLIHVQHEIGLFGGEAVWEEWLNCLKSFGVPVVVTYHSVPDVPNPLTDGDVSAAIVASPVGTLLLRSRVSMPVFNIEHAVDGPIPAQSAREAHSLVTFGFLGASKGYSRILEAMESLADDIPDLTLTVIGSLTTRSQRDQVDYLNQLLGEVHQRGLVDRVDISCGFRRMDEVRHVLQRKQIGVLHYDGTEALAATMGPTTRSAQLVSSSNGGWKSADTGTSMMLQRGLAIRCQSAALFRMWSSGLPTIVSQAQHFEVGESLEPAVIRAADTKSLSNAIRRLCLDQSAYVSARERLTGHVTRTWRHVAAEHWDVYTRVLAQAGA